MSPDGVTPAPAEPAADGERGADYGLPAEAFRLILPGYFYLLQPEPLLAPDRILCGFTTNLDRTLEKTRNLCPDAAYVKAWPCEPLWQHVAIICAFRHAQQLRSRLYRCPDLAAAVAYADAFFAALPAAQSEPRLVLRRPRHLRRNSPRRPRPFATWPPNASAPPLVVAPTPRRGPALDPAPAAVPISAPTLPTTAAPVAAAPYATLPAVHERPQSIDCGDSFASLDFTPCAPIAGALQQSCPTTLNPQLSTLNHATFPATPAASHSPPAPAEPAPSLDYSDSFAALDSTQSSTNPANLTPPQQSCLTTLSPQPSTLNQSPLRAPPPN